MASSKPSNPKLYARAKSIVKSRVKKWPSAYASAQQTLTQGFVKLVKGGSVNGRVS